MNTAIYAFSGDPVTFGHVDIVERASKIFGKVIAAIGTNPAKNYIFGLDERLALARQAFSHIPNVEVKAFKGLLSDFAYEQGVHVIIRGLRNSEDFNFELMLHQLGETQVSGIETFLMPCKKNLVHVSSSAAKALQLEQGFVQQFVPLCVKQKLEERISGQLIIGVTGEVASGKSTLCAHLKKLADAEDIKAHVVDVDKLAHDILEHNTETVYHEFRQKLAEQFGNHILNGQGFADRVKLGEIIFSNPLLLQQFNQAIYAPLLLRVRREIYGKRGLILLESAMLVETNSLFLCNNFVLLKKCKKGEQLERLRARGYTGKKIPALLNAQFGFDEKLARIEKQVQQHRFGKVHIIEDIKTEATDLFAALSKMIPAMAGM